MIDPGTVNVLGEQRVGTPNPVFGMGLVANVLFIFFIFFSQVEVTLKE